MTIRSTLFPARLVYPVVATCALSVGVVHAQANQFVVKDIEVEGLRRTEAGTVFSYLPIRVGDTFTDEKALQAIRSLFATGFFEDVKISAKGYDPRKNMQKLNINIITQKKSFKKN